MMKLTLTQVCMCCLLAVSLLACRQHKPVTQTSDAAAGQPVKASTKAPQGTVTVEVVEGLNLGNKAPEIEMADPAGKALKLSSLRGKLVLVDFWASWCGPCRLENPVVVESYNTYHNSSFVSGTGFEVFSVSLDSDKNRWINAIEKDRLVWPYHVCDMQLWNNAAAQTYKVNSIPTNVLVDGNGIIIAKNLRGGDLPAKLLSLKK